CNVWTALTRRPLAGGLSRRESHYLANCLVIFSRRLKDGADEFLRGLNTSLKRRVAIGFGEDAQRAAQADVVRHVARQRQDCFPPRMIGGKVAVEEGLEAGAIFELAAGEWQQFFAREIDELRIAGRTAAAFVGQ